MTTEEFFKHLYPNWGIFNCAPKMQAQLKINAECEKQKMLTFAKQYAQLKCAEQRQICADIVNKYPDIGWDRSGCRIAVKQAKEPEL